MTEDGCDRPAPVRTDERDLEKAFASLHSYLSSPDREERGHRGSPTPAQTDLVLREVTALLDRMDDVRRGAPDPPRVKEDRERFVHGYLDGLLAHREIVLLLCRYPAVLRHSALAPLVAELDQALHGHLAGRDADLERAVRSAVALAGMIGTVAADPSIDADTVRAVGARVSLAGLDRLSEAAGELRRLP